MSVTFNVSLEEYTLPSGQKVTIYDIQHYAEGEWVGMTLKGEVALAEVLSYGGYDEEHEEMDVSANRKEIVEALLSKAEVTEKALQAADRGSQYRDTTGRSHRPTGYTTPEK